MSFYEGQKVVCVIEGEWAATFNGCPMDASPGAPVKGKVYTVADVYGYRDTDGSPQEALVVEEIICRNRRANGGEAGWHAIHFRPVVERKTSISIFEAMLTKTPAELGREMERT